MNLEPHCTFAEMFDELDQYQDRIPLDLLVSRITRLSVERHLLEPFIRFAPDTYRRNLMHAGPAYQALILCWKSGQRSPIHDHRGSSCAVKIISGTATETIFAQAANGMMYATGSRQLAAGDSCASQDADGHQMANLQPEGTGLVTLHI